MGIVFAEADFEVAHQYPITLGPTKSPILIGLGRPAGTAGTLAARSSASNFAFQRTRAMPVVAINVRLKQMRLWAQRRWVRGSPTSRARSTAQRIPAAGVPATGGARQPGINRRPPETLALSTDEVVLASSMSRSHIYNEICKWAPPGHQIWPTHFDDDDGTESVARGNASRGRRIVEGLSA
jgi:hypothetical protein